jgi:hypothetical protein
MNWQSHFVWVQIEAAVKIVGWGPSDVVHYLWKTNPSGVFDSLHSSVIRRWVSIDECGMKCWNLSTVDRAEKGAQIGGNGRSRALVCPLVESPFAMISNTWLGEISWNC